MLINHFILRFLMLTRLRNVSFSVLRKRNTKYWKHFESFDNSTSKWDQLHFEEINMKSFQVFVFCLVISFPFNKGITSYVLPNANNVRDCAVIVQGTSGFIVNDNPAYPGSLGKLITEHIVKEYFDCVRLNFRLNGQKISQLTKEILQLKNR